MADVSVITRVDKTENGNTKEWPALVFVHCETKEGPAIVANDRTGSQSTQGLPKYLATSQHWRATASSKALMQVPAG